MDTSDNQLPSEPETIANASQDDQSKVIEGSTKPWNRKKPWNKQIYTKIAEQIEFYFSSSNLGKDRFMTKLIEEDPCKNVISLLLSNH